MAEIGLPPKQGKLPNTTSSTRSSTSSTSSGKGSGGGGGGGGGRDPYAAAQARADRKEKQAKAKAAKKYREQAKALDQQAKALRSALSKEFKSARRTRLQNISLVERQADRLLRQVYNEEYDNLSTLAEANERAEAGQSQLNLSNRARERSNALSQAMTQGAGETDVLKAQAMSLRNWEANQSEISRSFYDSLNSINASLTNLNNDTRTARINNAVESNAARDAVWTQFYNSKAESYTQLGNVLGQKAELLSNANEAAPNKKSRKNQRQAVKQSGNAFQQAASFAGKAWENPGVDKDLRTWRGEADFEGSSNASLFANAATTIQPSRAPEGASLRKW